MPKKAKVVEVKPDHADKFTWKEGDMTSRPATPEEIAQVARQDLAAAEFWAKKKALAEAKV